jgi:hypothetical protein
MFNHAQPSGPHERIAVALHRPPIMRRRKLVNRESSKQLRIVENAGVKMPANARGFGLGFHFG